MARLSMRKQAVRAESPHPQTVLMKLSATNQGDLPCPPLATSDTCAENSVGTGGMGAFKAAGLACAKSEECARG